MSDSAEQAARAWLDYWGKARDQAMVSSLAIFLHEREEAAFKAGAEAMREKAAATWTEWINLPSEEFNARMDPLARGFSEVIEALPLPEIKP